MGRLTMQMNSAVGNWNIWCDEVQPTSLGQKKGRDMETPPITWAPAWVWGPGHLPWGS